MSIRDPGVIARIEAAVAAAEEKTSAEVVVAIARSSGGYRDADLLAGAIASLAALSLIVYSPHFDVRHGLVLPIAAVVFLAATALSSRLPGVRRLLTTSARRRRQVVLAAKLAFFEERVAATRDRLAVLLYVSLEEGEVEILSDTGLDARVPRETWRAVTERAFGSGAPLEEAVVAGINEIGRALAPLVPKTVEDRDELPNRPRIR
ncbi:hypothetical protein HY251_13365 [bacterium]|nr:hypothetical protein [bacterium]